MMVQTILSGALVIAAAAWLLGRQIRPAKRDVVPCSGCRLKTPTTSGSCPSCPGASR